MNVWKEGLGGFFSDYLVYPLDKLLIGGTLRPVSGYTEGACNSYRFSWEFGFFIYL